MMSMKNGTKQMKSGKNNYYPTLHTNLTVYSLRHNTTIRSIMPLQVNVLYVLSKLFKFMNICMVDKLLDSTTFVHYFV